MARSKHASVGRRGFLKGAATAVTGAAAMAAHVPAAVTRWEDLAAKDDLVVAHLNLTPTSHPHPDPPSPRTPTSSTPASNPTTSPTTSPKPPPGASSPKRLQDCKAHQGAGVSRHRLDTSEVNTSHHSLDFTFTARNVSHTPTDGIRDKHGKTRNETTRPAGILTYPVPRC